MIPGFDAKKRQGFDNARLAATGRSGHLSDMVQPVEMAAQDFDPAAFDSSERPFIVIWEITRACELACRHCRAAAVQRRHPAELEGAEVERLLDEVAEVKPALFVITGGDPILRPDLFKVIRQARARGLRVSISPSATPRLDAFAIARFRNAGVARIALSLDAPDAARHDAFRGVGGTFDRTLEAIEEARRIGLGFQIHSTVCQETAAWFEQMPEFIRRLDPLLWSVFFLVPVGRGTRLRPLDSLGTERVLTHLYGFSRTVKFDVKTTEAPQYRRIALQRNSENVFQRRGFSSRGIPAGINDGKGFVFISHMGGIYPSGFLGQCCGNVRNTALKHAYRYNPLLRSLRQAELLKGKCGRCEFRLVCGGSRARAWALTGDPLGEDPACPYQPNE